MLEFLFFFTLRNYTNKWEERIEKVILFWGIFFDILDGFFLRNGNVLLCSAMIPICVVLCSECVIG